MISFEKYAKIPRLRGLRMLITEKIDGTNAQVYVPENDREPLQVGSRNRWISPGKQTDNYDFASWVQGKEEVLRRLGPGRHYGEWWGAGIGPRRYDLSERRFWLFDVLRFKDGLPEGLPANMGLVPVLYDGPPDMEHVEAAKENLRINGSQAASGFMNPEGIVVKIYDGCTVLTWKFTFDGDAKAEPSPEQSDDRAGAVTGRLSVAA